MKGVWMRRGVIHVNVFTCYESQWNAGQATATLRTQLYKPRSRILRYISYAFRSVCLTASFVFHCTIKMGICSKEKEEEEEEWEREFIFAMNVEKNKWFLRIKTICVALFRVNVCARKVQRCQWIWRWIDWQLLKKRNHDWGKQRSENLKLVNEDIIFEVGCFSVDLMLWSFFYLRVFIVFLEQATQRFPNVTLALIFFVAAV